MRSGGGARACHVQVTHKQTLLSCRCVLLWLLLALVVVLCCVVQVESVTDYDGSKSSVISYKGYRVYDVHVTDRVQASRVARHAHSCSGELWNNAGHPPRDTLQLQVPPHTASTLEQTLNQSGIAYRLRIADIQRLIDQQNDEVRRFDNDTQDLLGSSSNSVGRYGYMEPLAHRAYLTFTQIRRHLERMTMLNADRMRLEVIGRSHERRPIYMARVMSSVDRQNPRRHVMWIDCGIHAREWISPAVCMFILDRLLGDDSHWLYRYDWHVVPVVNPDGYEYSHRVDRLWRKNRSRNHYCRGVDLNRNFDALWGTFGVTFYECGATFPGYRAFSEPESRAVRDAVMRDSHRMVAFTSIHSYGQLWLMPYGFKWSRSADWRQQSRVARRATAAMRSVNGVRYRHGVSSLLLYLDSGTSTDWAYTRAHVQHSVAIEARDRGFYGFLLPAHLILPTATEVWAGLQVQAEQLLR